MEKIKALMKYKYLGKTGLKVSLFSYGNWLNSAKDADYKTTKECIEICLKAGINFYDTAEIYAAGQAEKQMGQAFKELKVIRKDIVVSTKILKCGDGPNDSFLSRKHIIEGLRNSLLRLGLDYVDVVFCHRPDYITPLEETCRAMSWCVDQGLAFYWGTSEWPAARISEAIGLCQKYNLHKPVVEQCLYNMFSRDRFEKEYKDIFEPYGYGTTIWSALAGGILTGKYNSGEIPAEARYANNPSLDSVKKKYFGEEAKADTVKKLCALADLAKEVGCTQAQLCLAWAIANGDVSTCILGFTRTTQIQENLAALEVLGKWSVELDGKIEAILGNKPVPQTDFRTWGPSAGRRSVSLLK